MHCRYVIVEAEILQFLISFSIVEEALECEDLYRLEPLFGISFVLLDHSNSEIVLLGADSDLVSQGETLKLLVYATEVDSTEESARKGQ